MVRTLIRAGALLQLVTVLVVPPVVVWALVGARPPTVAQLTDAFRAGTLDATTAIGVAALVFTGVWGWLGVVAVTEAVRATSARRPMVQRPRSPLALMCALARVAATAGASSLPVAPSVVFAAPAEIVAASIEEGEPQAGPRAPLHAHVATGRDTPYSIAVDVLGDPARRGEIVELNAGRCGPDGRPWSSGAFPAGMDVLLPAEEVTSASGGRQVVVEPGDSWWSLAREHLGDGHRWRELQAANAGARQPSGEVVRAGSTTLHPGWTIAVDDPADGPATSPPASGATHVVQPGETLGGIVAEHYVPASSTDASALVAAVFTANAGVTDPAGRPLVEPDLIHPGMVLVLPPPAVGVDVPATAVPPPEPVSPATTARPATTAPSTTTRATTTTTSPTTTSPTTTSPTTTSPTTTSPTTTSPTSTSPTTTTLERDVAVSLEGDRSQLAPAPEEPPAWVAAAGATGATLLATGLGAVVATRRRRRLRASRAGDRLAPIDPLVSAAEQMVHTVSDAVAAARLDLALRALASASKGSTARPVVVVRADDGTIEVQLDRPRVLASPWVACGEGSVCWSLPADVPVEQLVPAAGGIAPPCPALATVGRDGRGEVLCDLEAVGGLHVDAPPALAGAVLRSIALELAVTPLADIVHVVVAGLSLDGVRVPERLHVAADATEAADLARSLAGPAPLPGESMSTFVLRAQAGHEAWEPVVLVLGPEAELTGEPGARITVVGPPVPRGARLVCDGDQWRLEPVVGVITPVGLTDADVGAVTALLEEASASLVVAEASGTDDAPARVALKVEGPDADGEHELLVRVLGPVDVVDRHGKPVDFDRPKALELVVWLAQHRSRASRTAARTALWDLDVSNATFSNVVSDARRALARLVAPPDGEEWLARTYAESLPLHPLVALDADLVAARVEAARRLDDAAAVATLSQALALVRGAPYTGVHYLWPDAEALPSQLTLLATSVALELGRHRLERGDLGGVLDATATGLAVLPGHEELVCLRMRALAAAGDRSAVRREFAGYERAVLADPWSGGELADPVVALRNELLGAR